MRRYDSRGPALGLTLLESMTGRHPFEDLGPDEAVKARITHDFIPADLPRWVQEVLLKATHPTPELRFQTAGDFGEAIRGRLAMPPPALAMDFGGLRRITRRARVLLGLDDAAVVA